MTAVPATRSIKEAATDLLYGGTLSEEEFDAWLEAHDSAVRSQTLIDAATDFKKTWPVYPVRWLTERAGLAYRTWGKDWL